MEIIAATSVAKSFGGKPVLRDVNFSLVAGKIYGIKGANGAGKSVLLKIVASLLLPTSGSVQVAAEYRRPKSRLLDRCGVLIDRPGFISNLSGFENLMMLARIRKLIREGEVLEWMRTFNLTEAKDQRVGKYSLGMKQRLGLCQAFMEHQEVFLLDEPFNALDADSCDLVRQLLTVARSRNGMALLVSHDLERLSSLCDQVYELVDGHLLPA